jgi:hypothetical protein
MLALPPYELKDEDVSVTKEEFCLKLADLVAEILECGEKDLEKLEIRWQKGSASFRTLFKAREVSTPSEATGEAGSPAPVSPDDRCGTSDGVAAPAATL